MTVLAKMGTAAVAAVAAIVAAASMVSCVNFDDSEIWDKLNELTTAIIVSNGEI